MPVNIRNKTPLHRMAVFPLLRLQLVVTLLAGVSGWLWKGPVAGYSALLGGMIALLPNLYFTYKAFRYFGARSIRATVQSIWSGEMGKLFLTAALFALVFAGVERLSVAALFVGYALVLGIAASALLLVKGFPKH
jgi:ATP synthase protein I